MQKCYASISNTGLHCAWCVTRNDDDDNIRKNIIFKKIVLCNCYYCSDFIGYKPDYRMTDEEEQKLINELRND